jgi:hypothetical protein
MRETEAERGGGRLGNADADHNSLPPPSSMNEPPSFQKYAKKKPGCHQTSHQAQLNNRESIGEQGGRVPMFRVLCDMGTTAAGGRRDGN